MVVRQGGVTINFKEITLAQKPLFDSFFRRRRYDNAHFTFTNLFMWRNGYRIQWETEGDYLFIIAEWEGTHYSLMPFGPEDERLAGAVHSLQSHFAEQGWPFIMYGAEAFMVEALEQVCPGQFTWTKDENNFDYVYNVQELINLSGRKYHSKKNHLNSFKRLYGHYRYETITPAHMPACLEAAKRWWENNESDDVSLTLEQQAIRDALDNFEYLGLTGGAIMLENQVAAFTFGEPLNEDTAVIHIEKGNYDVRGIYAAINQEFCSQAWSDFTYVNREEDMGIPGLRKAKESYHPVKLIEKYIITPKA